VTANAAVPARIRAWFSPAMEGRLTLAVAAAASVVSLAASIPDALHFLFWEDEGASAHIILEPTLAGVFRHVSLTESTPPAWYVLAWIVHQAGATVHDLRFLSVIFAATLAGLAVVYARRFVSLPGAALVGLLTALGREFMQHSWELRAYSMFVLLCLLFAMTLEWASRSPSRGRLAALAVVVALGSTTHYFFLFSLFAGIAWLWLTPASVSVRRRVTAATAVGLLPLIAWSPEFAHQTAANHTKLFAGFSWSELGRAYSRILAPGLPKHSAQILAFVVIDIVVAVGLILLFRRRGTAALCAALALTPLVCAGILSRAGFHILDFRNLIGCGPFVAVAFVAAIEAIPVPAFARATLGAAFVLAVCGFVFTKGGSHHHGSLPGPAQSAIRIPQSPRFLGHGTRVRAADVAHLRASRADGS
jgi:hypothetical protein